MELSKKRNLSFDLLKIIAMLMIVMLHFLGKGGALNIEYRGTSVYNIAWLLETFCIVAVNVYVLISGYFLIDSNFKVKKVLKLWGQVLFYSIVFLLIALLLGQSINKEQLAYSIFPITTKNGYWFMTVYLCMYILSPYINKLIKSLSKREHFILLIILIVVFSIMPTILPSENSLDPSMRLRNHMVYNIIYDSGIFEIIWFKCERKKILTTICFNNFIYLFH